MRQCVIVIIRTVAIAIVTRWWREWWRTGVPRKIGRGRSPICTCAVVVIRIIIMVSIICMVIIRSRVMVMVEVMMMTIIIHLTM